ncbi:MAG: hypothetical protein IKP31_07510 [Lachnospiraceae bacterium]|nr:hypothetical protein [Lachnospiraceae bacterium]
MESFSRFASKLEKNLNINKGASGSRDGYDRTRTDRDYADRRRTVAGSVSIEQIKDTVTDCNERQLDVIQDFIYDERANRDSSDKEILRAVDSNTKLLNKNYRLLSDIMDDLDSEEKIDYKSLSEANKEEILKAVFSNTEMLKLLKEELIDKKEEEAKDNVFDKATAEKAFIDMEDHVHKEAIKCYRNVQEVITEQDAQTYGKVKRGLNAIKALVAVTLVFGIANLAFIICWFFRIIP